jgi:hypothetical protein
VGVETPWQSVARRLSKTLFGQQPLGGVYSPRQSLSSSMGRSFNRASSLSASTGRLSASDYRDPLYGSASQSNSLADNAGSPMSSSAWSAHLVEALNKTPEPPSPVADHR